MTADRDMKFCSNCGRELQEDMRFCPYCGTAAEGEADRRAAGSAKKPRKKRGCLKFFLILLLLLAVGFTGLVWYVYRHYRLDVDPYDGLSSEEFQASCVEVTYADLAHYPDTYNGAHIKISGKVIQSLGDGAVSEYRVATDNAYGDIIYCLFNRQEGDARLMEGDYVTIYGLGQGLYTYRAVSGASITLPLILITVTQFH